MQLSLKVFIISLGLSSGALHAGELIEVNTTTRALGMGNAFVGQAVDSDALFYNPAGLVRSDGYTWRFLGAKVGLNGQQALTTIQSMMSATDFSTVFANSYGQNVWLGGGAITAFTSPYFGFAVYDNLSSSFLIGNPASPSITLASYNDFAYVAGFAYPVLPMLHLGLNLRYIRRFGAEQTFSAASFATISATDVQNAIRKESRGYAVDMAINFIAKGPVAPMFAFVWKDIGSTAFSPVDATQQAPPAQRDEMILGAGIGFDAGVVSVVPELNFKYLNRTDVQLGRKIHLGVELGLPLLDLRAGFNQGYYTLGLGLDMGLMRLDAATYGVELGEYPGQLEDRRYMVEFAFELGLGSEAWGGGGSGAGASRGFFGQRKRLKQRR